MSRPYKRHWMNLNRGLKENQIHLDLNIHHSQIYLQSYLRLKYDQSVHVLKQSHLMYNHSDSEFHQDLAICRPDQ